MVKFATVQVEDTSTGAFERAGFTVEKRGPASVAERDLPEQVVETTRALIKNGNGNKNTGAPVPQPSEQVGVPG